MLPTGGLNTAPCTIGALKPLAATVEYSGAPRRRRDGGRRARGDARIEYPGSATRPPTSSNARSPATAPPNRRKAVPHEPAMQQREPGGQHHPRLHLAVLFALAIAHWMASCWDAGPAAVCARWRRPPCRCRVGCANCGCAGAHVAQRQAHGPRPSARFPLYLRLLDDDRVHLLELRTRLARQQTRQLVLASEQ